MKRIWIVIVMVIVAFVGVYFGLKKTSGNSNSTMTTADLEEYTVKRMDLRDTVSVMGQLSIPDDRRYEIKPYISGVVSKVLVEEGQRVKRGELLAELDDKTERLDYLKAKSNYEDALLGSSKQLVEQKKLELAIAEENLSYTRITSPIDGKVYYVNVREGDRVGLSTTMFVVADDSELIMTTSVDEIDYSKVKLGQPVIITLDAFEGKHLFGKVTKIAPEAETHGGLTTVPIEITVMKKRLGRPASSFGKDLARTTMNSTNSNWINKVISGLSADGEIIVASKNNALVVPIQAIGYEGIKTFVLKKGEDGKPVKAYVKTGLTTDEYAEITSGLKEGDVIYIKYTKSALQEKKFGVIRRIRGIVPRVK